MSSGLPWDYVASFLAVLREGSLSAAARTLGVAQPTVRRHIEALEASLGTVLFTRSPAGLIPTDAAEQARPFAEAMAASAAALGRSAHTEPGLVGGSIRLSCSEMMAIEVIPALIAPLLAQHPLLEIELVASNQNDDLLRRDADIAVRMARPTQTGLVARKIGDIPLGLYASQPYIDQMPAPRSLADLIAHAALIGEDRRTVLESALMAMVPGADLHFRMRSDNDAVQLSAIRAGIGIGICQRPIAARDFRLRPVLPDLDFALECWLVMHEDLRGQARARAVFDHLAAAIAAYIGD